MGHARGGTTPQLAWALAQTQLQLSLSQAQPFLEVLTFPADLPADFCVNSAGNIFPTDFAKDLGSEVKKYLRILGSAGKIYPKEM